MNIAAATLAEENRRLSERLDYLEEVLRAIRGGEVDAMVVDRAGGEQIYTLSGALEPYRVMVETMSEGAATLAPDGTVLYANDCMARMVKSPLQRILGAPLRNLVAAVERDRFDAMLAETASKPVRANLALLTSDSQQLPVMVSMVALPASVAEGVAVVISDMSAAAAAIESKSRLAMVVDSSNEAIISTDLDGFVQSWNRAAEGLFGYSAAEVIGRPIAALIVPPMQAHETAQVYDGARCGQCVSHVETVRLRKDGTSFATELSASPIHNAAGTIIGVSILYSDISRRKRAEAELQLSTERMRRTFEVMSEGLVVHNEEGRIVDVNHAAECILELDREHLLQVASADPRWQSIHEDGAPYLSSEHPAMVALRTGGSLRNQIMGIATANGRRWISINAVPFASTDPSRPAGVVASFIDITERRRIEQALIENESLFRGVFENAAVGIAQVALDGRFLKINEEFCAIIGYDHEEVLSKDFTFQKITFPDDLASDLDHAQALLRGEGARYALEKRYIRKDGELVWVALAVFLQRDHTGEPEYFISAVLEITQRKQAEIDLEKYRYHLEELVEERTAELTAALECAEQARAELERSQAEIAASHTTLEAALGAMSDAVFISDTAGRFIHFNDAFATFHKFIGKEDCAKTLAEYPNFLDVFSMKGERLPLEQWAVPRALRGEIGNNAEFMLHRRDSDEKWIGSYNFAPIRDPGGDIVGSVVTGRDITASKTAELVLVQAKEAAESANKAKNIFLSTMSHELRTPLNGIMGMTALALRRAADPKQIEQLGKVTKASEHLLAIIKDVLDISRIEANKLKLELLDFSLDGILENVEALIRAQLTGKAIELSFNIAPEIFGLSLHGDPRRLSQILINLTANAIKFTAVGAVDVIVLLVEEHPNNALLRFEVHDTGIGISPDDQSRLFRNFEQVDGSTTRKYGGSGLGLAISKRLVELMDGAIGVDSKLGAGSTFWFTVRMAKTGHVVAVVPATEKNAARDRLQAQHPGAYILVTDDESDNREIIQGLLEEIGLVVHFADNGAKAVELARRTNYDVILMDLQMPVMDGLEATQLIRAQPNNPGVPIIALTANVFAEDEARCKAAGMDDFIARPAESEEIYAAVLKWLNVRKA